MSTACVPSTLPTDKQHAAGSLQPPLLRDRAAEASPQLQHPQSDPQEPRHPQSSATFTSSHHIDRYIPRLVPDGKYDKCRWTRTHWQHSDTWQEITLTLQCDVDVTRVVFEQLQTDLAMEPPAICAPDSFLRCVRRRRDEAKLDRNGGWGGWFDEPEEKKLPATYREVANILNSRFSLANRNYRLIPQSRRLQPSSFGFFVRKPPHPHVNLTFNFEPCRADQSDTAGRECVYIIDEGSFPTRKVMLNIHVTASPDSNGQAADTMQTLDVKIGKKLHQFHEGFYNRGHYRALQFDQVGARLKHKKFILFGNREEVQLQYYQASNNKVAS